jgi:hypothetical protein
MITDSTQGTRLRGPVKEPAWGHRRGHSRVERKGFLRPSGRHVTRGIHLAVVVLLLAICSATGWADLTPAQMYLNPSAVPVDAYDYDYQAAGYTTTFSNVTSLQVLPPMVTGGMDYYFTPTVDYTGDIIGTDGRITFIRPGPYFVLVTYTDATTDLFDYGIEFLTRPGPANTYNWHVIPTPSPDVVITDPSLASSNPDFPAGTTEINDAATWEDVKKEMKKLTDAHVEVGGHGSPGSFVYAGTVIDSSNIDSELSDLKGHVSYLTFMSCSTGAGTQGDTFLSGVANILGKSAGYTDVVGGNGTKWFINGDGTNKVVPTPGSLVLGLLGLGLMRRFVRRRHSYRWPIRLRQVP